MSYHTINYTNKPETLKASRGQRGMLHHAAHSVNGFLGFLLTFLKTGFEYKTTNKVSFIPPYSAVLIMFVIFSLVFIN